MRKPIYSIFTMTGPNRLLNLIREIHIVKTSPLTVFVDGALEIYGDWIVKLLDTYGIVFNAEKPWVLDYFDEVIRFPISDDYGEFPDTMGYDSKHWETLESDMEDPALMPYMTRGADAVYERMSPYANKYNKDYDDVEDFMNSPKFGGPIFLCVGFVMIGEKHESNLIQVPRGTTIKGLESKKALADILISGRN